MYFCHCCCVHVRLHRQTAAFMWEGDKNRLEQRQTSDSLLPFCDSTWKWPPNNIKGLRTLRDHFTFLWFYEAEWRSFIKPVSNPVQILGSEMISCQEYISKILPELLFFFFGCEWTGGVFAAFRACVCVFANPRLFCSRGKIEAAPRPAVV